MIMNNRFIPLLAATLILLAPVARAQQAEADDEAKAKAEVEKIVKGLKFQHGEINLEGGFAKITVPPEFKFLGKKDAKIVLEDLWDNPPTDDTLGILLPARFSPLDTNCWVVEISYQEDGYVKDKDASKIDYADLMKTMKKEARTESKDRVKQGYEPIELVGWAAPPHYDAETHKLYWAKEIKFGDDAEHTLNYNIRILGRRGVLVLNAISHMKQLPEIEEETPKILGMVNFNDGHRYADFDPKADKVAAYGIAALIAGGLAAKAGFFKIFWVALLAAKKFVIIGFLAVVGFLKKIFSRKGSTTRV
jgi:uncharacterized membrane-anchored protein